jgi:DNA-binding beta-propeller fold protein YncE
MNLTDSYDGSGTPFEGDQTIVWASLPAGARVSKARLTLTPAASDRGELFREEVHFTGSSGEWGATKTTAVVNSQHYVEIDFHKRRTLVAVIGANGLSGASVQIDMGGVSVDINAKGAIKTPTDPDPFQLPGDGTLPGLTVSKFRLIASSAATEADLAGVVVRSVPANISARLGKMATFWSRTGDLTAADTSPDFSDLLQVFLNNAEVQNGFYQVPLVVHSDVVARLQAVLEVEYLQQASVLPEGVKEVVLPFDFGSLPKTRPDVLQVSLPPNARVTPATSAKVLGAFNESRVVFGPTGEVTPAGAVTIRPTDSQAQIFALDSVASATSIDLLIAAQPPGVRLAVDVRADFDGKPDATSFLGDRVELNVPSRPDKQAAWVNVPLTGEVQFQAGDKSKYWLVLQTLQGEAAWSVQPTPDGKPVMQHTQDGGLSWRETPAASTSPPSGFFRLRSVPDKFQVPVDLLVGSGSQAQRVKLDRFQPLGRVDFSLGVPEVAAGFNSFLAGATPGGCAEAEHLANGDFEQWTIIGSDPGQPAPVQSVAPSIQVTAVAVSGNGRTAYATAVLGEAASELEMVDVACNRLLGSIALKLTAFPDTLLLYPDGTRALVVGTDVDGALGAFQVELVDLVKASSIGKTRISASSLALAFSADGNRLYMAAVEIASGQTTQISGTVVDAQGAVISGATVKATKVATGQSKTAATTSSGNYIVTNLTPGEYNVRVEAHGFASAEGDGVQVSAGDQKRLNFILAVAGSSQMVDVTTQTALFSIDTVDIEPAVLNGNLSDKMRTINATLAGRVAAMAASQSTLYVLLTDAKPGGVFLVDLQTEELDPNPIELENDGNAIAVTPDGSHAIVANQQGNTVMLINLRHKTVFSVDLTLGAPGSASQPLSPVAVAVSPDNRRAFVAGNVEVAVPQVAATAGAPDAAVAIIDMAGKSQLSAVSLPGRLSSLAVTPQGDEVFVGSDDQQPMVYIPLGVRVPADWFLTSGAIQLACLPGLTDAHIVALLGNVREKVPTQPSAISQVAPVSEACAFEFSFQGLTNSSQAVAEVLWRGEGCQPLREDSTAIPQVGPGSRTSSAMMVRSQSFRGAATPEPEFRLIKKVLRLTPPPGANGAEVRFRVSEGAAVVASPSLMSTSEAVLNGDLKSLQQGIPEQWTISPANARGLSVAPRDSRVQIGNHGTGPLELVQELPVQAGQDFTLAFIGHAVAAAADESPRLELHWLKNDSSETGTPTGQDILPMSFDSRLMAGKVPDGAAKAALHLRLPSGAALVVDEVSLRVPQTTAVPVSFVAQSPGELRISGAQVTYDIAPAGPPPVPATGLCPPTPPPDAAEDKPSADCYCPCCQGPVQMATPSQVMTPSGRPMTVGQCPECGETVVRGGGKTATSDQPAPLRVVTIAPHPTPLALLPSPAASPAKSTARPLALTDVQGIGPARAQQLSRVGIRSVQDLAAAEPAHVAVALQGVTLESAKILVDHARKIMQAPV